MQCIAHTLHKIDLHLVSNNLPLDRFYKGNELAIKSGKAIVSAKLV